MSQPAIEVSGLSKRYVIQHESRHDNLRDTLHHNARKLWRRFRWGTGFETEDFYALRDVSFTVQPGEVVGIVGRNGAGKSTLLKVLSRITEPTTGRVALRGRVASLLEVGTGFHPDLTGRENVFLNGAILGMSRAEIRAKFDEIVAFAEVERFLDTPVKRYSSGMYVRLAFAVAAHLEPEILIVDEVLAVGDDAFQKKCLGKMREVAASHSRTVLFVSHNMSAVHGLCQRALLLEGGRTAAFGPTDEVVGRYLQQGGSSDGRYVASGAGATRTAAIAAIELRNAQNETSSSFGNGSPLTVRIEYARAAAFTDALCPSVVVRNGAGVPLFHHHSKLNKQLFGNLPPGGSFSFQLAKLPLPAGTYYVSAGLVANGRLLDHAENVLEFHVTDGSFFAPGEYSPASHGVVLVDGEWSTSATAGGARN
jgi:lipopolysaccharide transport system ATP-binding protein